MDHYYFLGKSGLKVSQLALGTMTFGVEWGWGSEKAEAQRIFDTYIDAGGNFVDTADLYTDGTSELWTGEFIDQRQLRDKVVLSTKFSFNAEPGNPNAGGNGRKNMMRALEGSLKRLNTDYIDLYIMHTWDSFTPVEEVMRTLNDMVSAGKVRYIALSDVPAWYAARAQTLSEWRGYEPLCALQLEYSLAERNIEREHVPLAQALGMGIMVWSPLASGLLSGKYTANDQGFSGEGRLEKTKDTSNPAFAKFNDRNKQILCVLEQVANELNAPMAQVALSWVVNQPGVSSVILGASKLHQLESNLAALSIQIPDALMTKLNQASQPDIHFPYTFFEPEIQGMVHGGVTIADKPSTFFQQKVLTGAGAGI